MQTHFPFLIDAPAPFLVNSHWQFSNSIRSLFINHHPNAPLVEHCAPVPCFPRLSTPTLKEISTKSCLPPTMSEPPVMGEQMKSHHLIYTPRNWEMGRLVPTLRTTLATLSVNTKLHLKKPRFSRHRLASASLLPFSYFLLLSCQEFTTGVSLREKTRPSLSSPN